MQINVRFDFINITDIGFQIKLLIFYYTKLQIYV